MDEREVLSMVRSMTLLLNKQRTSLMPFHDYYAGKHRLPYVPLEEDQTEFVSLLERSCTNWCRKVIDLTSRRLDVLGLTSPGSPEDAKKLWAIWEKSNMGSAHKAAHRSALRYGLSYVQVGRRAGDNQTIMRPMSPMNTVHVMNPDDPDVPLRVLRRVNLVDGARVKAKSYLWTAGEWFIVDTTAPKRKQLVGGETGLDRPSVVVMRNQPDEDGGWLSDLDGILPIQDRINQTIADRLMVQTYGAYRQRLLLGWAPEIDEATGQYKKTIRPAVQRFMFINKDPDKVKALEFEATPLEPFIKATDADIQHLAALSDTPPHHLLGAMINIGPEALKAAESAQTGKADERKSNFTDPWENGFRLVAQYEGLDQDPALQLVWKDTEPYSEAARMDALSKKKGLDVPRKKIWSEMGYAPEVIDQMEIDFQEQRREDAKAQAVAFGVDQPAA